MGAAKSGLVVGAAEPAASSTVTATRSASGATLPRWRCIAVPSPVDWNSPAGAGLPVLGITHISYVLPAGRGGRLLATSSTPWDRFTNTLPRGGVVLPSPNVVTVVSAPLTIAKTSFS